MTIRECYGRLNGDFDDAVDRLGSERLVGKFMLRFSDEGGQCMQALREAVAAGDVEASFRASHALKGLAANLSFTAFAEKASELCDSLRPLTAPADPSVMEELEARFQCCLDALEAYRAGNA